MVSTRQMAITTGPSANDDGFQPTTAQNRSGPSTHHHSNGVSNGSVSPLSRRSTSPDSDSVSTNSSPDQINLQDLPIEVLDKIFGFLGYKKVAQMRMVSQTMNQLCSLVLNSTFQKLQTKMGARFQAVKAKMPRRESARRMHPLACECDILETCSMRLQLLQMTFGKHIERKHICFFPGAILDEVYSISHYIRTTHPLARPYKVTDELFDLSTMAMEYFKESLEPNLPEIFLSKDFLDYQPSNSPSYLMADPPTVREDSCSPPPPQSNMVLRKGIRKIKQGMKRYNNQLSVLRNELRTCKRKATEQSKQIAEQQKLLAEQQKQTLEYANRLDENDKKNEEIARKFSTLLQELNKCKTELQYWRSKSPATPVCQACGQVIIPVPPEDIQALINQGFKPAEMELGTAGEDAEAAAVVNAADVIVDNNVVPAAAATAAAQPQFLLFDDQPLSPISITTTAATMSGPTAAASSSSSSQQKLLAGTNGGVVAVVGNKRKSPIDDSGPSSSASRTAIGGSIVDGGGGGAGGVVKSDNSNAKKIRRVQTKARSQLNVANSNAKTRSK